VGVVVAVVGALVLGEYSLGALAGIVAGVVLGFAVAEAALMTLGYRSLDARFAAVLAVAAFFAVMSAIALGWLSRIRWRWLTTAGALTYPLYLIHENLGWAVITKTHDYMGAWTAVLLATIVALTAAVLLHVCVEKPLGGRLRRATLAMIRRTARPSEDREDRGHRARVPVPRHASAAGTGRPDPGALPVSRRAGSRTARR